MAIVRCVRNPKNRKTIREKKEAEVGDPNEEASYVGWEVGRTGVDGGSELKG